MKKGLLRTLSAVVAISMLFCMSVVAFADVTTSTSVTSYDVAAGKVTVTTEVAGAQPGEQVAFLVEKGTNILWIDQKPANTSGAASSSFTATVDEAVDAVAKVGTTNTAATAITQDGAIALPNYTVTWTSNSTKSQVVAVAGNADIDTDATSVSTTDTVTFYVICAPDEQLATINDEAATLVGGAISFNVGATKVTAYDFVFEAKAVTEAAATATKGAVATYTAETKKASVAATAANATEFGIVVAKEGYDFSTIDFASIATDGGEGVEVIKLAALGANAEGQFVIVIDDAAGTFFVEDAKYVAQVYAVNNGVAALSGEAFALN